MRIVKAAIPFICYAVATFVAMEVFAATGGIAQAWLLFSLPLLVLAYAEAGRAVGFGISTGSLLLYALVGGIGHWVAPFFGSDSEFSFASIWILVEVGVIAGMLIRKVKHVVVWFLAGSLALGVEWVICQRLCGPELFAPDFATSVLEVETMRGRFRLLTLGLLSVDLVRNVALFALAYRWRIKSEVAGA